MTNLEEHQYSDRTTSPTSLKSRYLMSEARVQRELETAKTMFTK